MKGSSVMDIGIASALAKSCLQPSITSSDYVIRKVENVKFAKNVRYAFPIQDVATRCLIPVAYNITITSA
jgi:hypothetical protein